MNKLISCLAAGCLALLASCAWNASAQIVISEIHYHPVEEPVFNTDGTPFLELTNDVHEFVELQNAGAAMVDLSGWTLAGGISYTFPTNTTMAAGAFCVIAKNPTRLASVYSLAASNVLGPYSAYLGNDSDTVRVRDAAGNAVDALTYDSKFPWAQSADALGAQDRFTGLGSTNYQYRGRSLQRVSVTWPSGDPANWLASPLTGPTPSAAQAVTRTIPKPVVVACSTAQIGDGATIIRSNQAVTVNCTFSATNSLSGVTLEYFLQNINVTNPTKTSVTMTDLGGARYTAPIPGQTNRSIVRYRFKADRGDGVEVVSPRADDPPVTAFGTSFTNILREAWYGYFVTPTRSTTNPAIYDVFVSTAWQRTMSNNILQNPKRVTAASATGLPRDIPYVAITAPQWDGTVPGVFCSDGRVWDVHIRFHGSRYHRDGSIHSYKLFFPKHQPLNDQASWFETMHGNEFIEAQKVNRLLGLPASQMRRVDWYLNNASNEVHSEQGEYSDYMLKAWSDLQQQLNPGMPKEDVGDLYKDVGNRDASQNNKEGPYTRGDEAPMLANAGWNQLQRYQWTFTPEVNEWKGPKPLRDLLEGMWTARGDAPATRSYTNTSATVPAVKMWYTNNWDIGATITSLALLEWMSIWDDAAQNHYFWRRANGLWTRLGWDYDGVMSTTGAGGPGGPGGGGAIGGTTNQTIYGGEAGAPVVFDGTNWWKDTLFKTFRNEYNQRLWELNNSFFDPVNLGAQGLTIASNFARFRQGYVNAQLASLGAYYKPKRPTNSYPVTGSSVVGATNFATTAYSHPQSTPHYATKWEIRAASGNYEEPVLRVTTTNASLTSYPIPLDQLTYGRTYYWRTTHLDANNHPSIVSAETSFTWGTSNTTAGVLVMNEILACNRNATANGGKHPDYLELHNNGSTNFPLAGYALTDDPLQPAKYPFPADLMLIPGGYLLVWCDRDTNAPGLHAGFGLNEEGQTVLLMYGSTIVDSVSFGPQAPDVSIGRIVNGTGGWQANTPTPGTANSAETLGLVGSLRINEWMADPAYGEDWLEIHNTDSNVVALAGLWLSDTPSTPMITQIPALSFIEPKGFARFWADGSTAGGARCNFKLSKSGDDLVLTAANGATTIDTITFSSQANDVSQGRLPDGASTTVSFSAKTASPGYCNWAPAPVCINELLANSGSPLEDAVELYNTNSSAVNIGGWWLSDDLVNRQKFQIPAGTILPAGGYKVFYAADFAAGAVPFEINAKGDEVILSAVDSSGRPTGYGSLVRLGASAENVTFGRVMATGLNASSGGTEFWPQTAHTFGQDIPANVATFRTGAGAANAGPQIGPVTINEIMYHPPDLTNVVGSVTNTLDNTRDEFVELCNVTTNTVDLSGWRFKGDAEFTFADGSTVPAGGYLLLVSFNPTVATNLAAFRTSYNLSTNVVICGPYSEKLANSTFDFELAYPALISGYTNYVNVDKVEYRDTSPWPTAADGGGKSLQRASSSVIGNTAANWTGNTPTPGAANLGAVTNVFIVTASPLVGGVIGTGYTNTFVAAGGSAPYSWAVTVGSVPGLLLATDGVLSGTPTTMGSNLFTVQITDNIGSTATKPFTLVIAATSPAITTSATLPAGALGAAYLQTLAATGGTAPYIWALSAGTPPPGITLNSAGVLSGTPTNYGTYSFTGRLTDSAGLAAAQAFSIYIPVAQLVITSVSPLVAGQQGAAYSQALTAVGGITPYSWSTAGESLPPGLTLSSVGDLAGTPTNLGTYNFTARVTDSASNATTKPLSITILSPTLTIATDELPASTVGAAYWQTLAATGGTAPYTWSIVWGELPGNWHLSSAGLISGAATNAGTFSFTVQAADSASATASRLFTVAIQNNAPVILVQSVAGGVCQLLVSGDPGPDYAIEASTNLLDWTAVCTSNAPAMPFTWSDPHANDYPARFFRASLVPPEAGASAMFQRR